MLKLRGPGAVVVCAVLALPRASFAQAAPQADKAIDVQLFETSIGPKTFFTVDSADGAKPEALALDFLLTYLTNPFTVYNSSGPSNTMIEGTLTHVVKNVTAGQLVGAYGLSDKLQLGASLPIIFRMSGDGIDTTTGMTNPNGLGVSGIGDLIAEAKYKVWQQDELKFAGIGGISLPGFGSDGSQFVGDKYPTLRLRGAVSWSYEKLSLGGTLGFIFRDPQHFYGTTIGQQMTFGGAAAYAITDRFSAVAELYGRMGLQDFSQNNSPVEAVGGLRVGVNTDFAVMVGGGGGLDHGIGAPTGRAFASVSYAPGMFKGAKAVDTGPCGKDLPGFDAIKACPDDDADHDGIRNKDDKCPNQAEDHDGFEDDDGCPDLDNDKDGIPDLQDRCPNDPEDGKEPFPKDGCPSTKRDSDGDGIPDAYDSCPLEEEDFDNFEDGDGCPDLDNDHDGVPDAADKCPVCPEDKDGFEDSDGCPDMDNDHDGIPDSKDQCPNEPETINGFKDDDGCPDTGGQVVVHLEGDRMTIDKVPDMKGKDLSKNGEVIANEIALTMRGVSVDLSIGHPAVTKWLLAVSLKNKADAQRLGDALKEYLGKRGMPNIEVLAAAGAPKLVAMVQERSADDAPFVCPAGMEVKPRPELEKPKGLMPGAKGATENATPAPAPAPTNATPAPAAPAGKPGGLMPADDDAPAPAPAPAPKPDAKAKKPDAPAKKPAPAPKKPDKKDDVEIDMDPQ